MERNTQRLIRRSLHVPVQKPPPSRLQALARRDSIVPTRRNLVRRGMIMAITVYSVTPSFAAEIGDVDLATPIDPTDLRGIKDAFTQYAVLIFPDQHLSQDQHLDFAKYFGPLETTIAVYRKDAALRLRKEFADVSNLNHENEVWGKESRLRSFQLGNRLWHTDSSCGYLRAHRCFMRA